MKTDNISEKLNRVFEELAQSAQEDAQKPRKSTGFPSLDKLTTGLADGDFIMIGSRPAMGKTALVLDIANHLAKERSKTTVLFSLEMSNEQIVHRLQRISGHEYTKADNLFIYDDPWITVEKISEICKKIENLSVVIVDYFQLIDDPAYHTENKMHRGFAYSSISRGLKQLARDLMVPVVCTMHSAIFEVEESLNAIEFYQHHPEYKPFVGNNFDKYRILQVGESHYIGQGAKDRMDEFPITYFDKWWEDPCVKLCEWPDPNPKEGKWGDWYNTRGVVDNFIANRSTGGYNIFANMIRSFDCVYGNGQVYMDVDARQRYHYFAFMNFFQMPALYNGVKFWDSLYISAKKIGDTSLAGNMFDLAAKKSAEVLDQVIETIKPNAIVISSREAGTAYEKYGKYRGNEVGPAIIHTVHPCCSWWNRKIRRYNGRTGREYFEDELRALHLK